MGGHDQSDRLFEIAHRKLLWLPIFGAIVENWHTPPSFCALAFHNGWEDSNADACVDTADDPSISDKNWVNFGPITSEFCWRVYAGRTMRWALPRIQFHY